MWVWIPKFPFLTRSHWSAALEACSPELLDAPRGVPVCGVLQAPRRFVGHDKLTALGLWSPFGSVWGTVSSRQTCAVPSLLSSCSLP